MTDQRTADVLTATILERDALRAEVKRLRADLMCRRQEILALLEPVRLLLDGRMLTDVELEYYEGLYESLAPDEERA